MGMISTRLRPRQFEKRLVSVWRSRDPWAIIEAAALDILAQVPSRYWFVPTLRCGVNRHSCDAAAGLVWLLAEWLYNHQCHGLASGHPWICCHRQDILESGCSLVKPRTAPPSRLFWTYNLFLVLQTQVWAQLIDINVDAAAGRRTTAVVLGAFNTRLLLAAVLVAEVLYVWQASDDVRTDRQAALEMFSGF